MLPTWWEATLLNTFLSVQRSQGAPRFLPAPPLKRQPYHFLPAPTKGTKLPPTSMTPVLSVGQNSTSDRRVLVIMGELPRYCGHTLCVISWSCCRLKEILFQSQLHFCSQTDQGKLFWYQTPSYGPTALYNPKSPTPPPSASDLK